jgi:molybdate transport system permease protein
LSSEKENLDKKKNSSYRARSDIPFLGGFGALSGFYILAIVMMIASLCTYFTFDEFWKTINQPHVIYSIKLSMLSCTISAILSVWVAVPIGYIMSRFNFRGKTVIDSILDIPIVLPPLVIGLCLLIFFSQTAMGHALESACEKLTSWIFGKEIGITYDIPAVIISQFMVACAFAVRTMRVTFDQIDDRYEKVAMTLGCSRGQAFWAVVLPQANRGLIAAGTLAWARSLGEFGPILVFAAATEMKTEVLSTTVFLELQVGNIEGSVAASMIMIISAMTVLILARVFGLGRVAI